MRHFLIFGYALGVPGTKPVHNILKISADVFPTRKNIQDNWEQQENLMLLELQVTGISEVTKEEWERF